MTQDMTTGTPLKQILRFCVPLLIGNLFQQFYNLADSIIVGRMLGVDAFAAVGSTGSLSFLVMGFAIGVCSGFAIPIAQSFGAGDMDAVRRRCAQTIWLCVFVTALLTTLTFFGTDWILQVTNTPIKIYADAYRYIFIVFMGTGATILYNMASCVLRALGDSRSPLYFLVAAALLNIALDLLFMGPMQMHVEGAAYATVISQALAGIGCLIYIRLRVPLLHLRRQNLKLDLRELWRIAVIGVPMGLQFSITAVGSIILQSAVNSLGANTVAAISAAFKVQNILAAPMETAGLTLATYCGQNLGAGKIDRIRKGVRQTTVLAMLYCVAAFCASHFFGATIAQLFIDADEADILAQVQYYLTFSAFFYPTLAVIFLYRNSLQGMGFSNSAMLAGIAELLPRAAAALWLTEPLGYLGVCLGPTLAWVLADLVLLPLYFIKVRQLQRRQDIYHHRLRDEYK